jgi:DNA-nicking Smr family endonuclease
MKKKKTQKRGPFDFNNNPFKSLKRFQPAADSGQRKKTTTSVMKEKADDDVALFLREVHGARAINPPSQPEENKGIAAEKPRGVDGDEQELFLQAVLRIGTTFRDELTKADGDDTGRRSANRRIRQLKRGTIVLSDELDLHGYVKGEALKRLEQFIAGAYSQGQRAVLVITGKGINSAEGPVLQGAVAAWLRREGRGMVAEFAPAPRDKGGSGAFVVLLKT